MSENQASFVLPTSIAVHRYRQMRVESIVNTPYKVTDEKSPAEYCLSSDRDPERTVGLLNLPEEQAEIALDLLSDLVTGGSPDEVYGPRGGVLCILMPTTSPAIDLIWQSMEAGVEGAPSVQAFVNQPNELFAGLSPAQVWVGAGKHEMALAEAWLPSQWKRIAAKEFPSPGAANTEWLSQLRLWSYNPAQGYSGRVVDIIHQERNENLARRRALCAELGISTVFVAPD